MKLRDLGLSKSDLQMIEDLTAAHANSFLDANGAPPPKTINDPPEVNPDYVSYIQAARIAQSANIFRSQVEAWDVLNTSDTDPAAILTGQAGTY